MTEMDIPALTSQNITFEVFKYISGFIQMLNVIVSDQKVLQFFYIIIAIIKVFFFLNSASMVKLPENSVYYFYFAVYLIICHLGHTHYLDSGKALCETFYQIIELTGSWTTNGFFLYTYLIVLDHFNNLGYEEQ